MRRQVLLELVDMPENIDGYDVVFLVFPLWWNTIPKPVEAFLNRYDFSGKSVIPVVTHGGSGAGRSITAIDRLFALEKGDGNLLRGHGMASALLMAAEGNGFDDVLDYNFKIFSGFSPHPASQGPPPVLSTLPPDKTNLLL